MTTRRNVVSPRAIALAAIAVIAAGWVLLTPPLTGDAGRASASSVHRGNGLRARPSIRVRAAQRALRKLGYHLRVDGRFGRRTERAVRRYQSRHGLRVDGIVGRSTRRALRRSVARVDRVRRARARRAARRARARRHRRAHAHHAKTAPRTVAPPAAVLPSPAAPRPSGSPRPVPPASVTEPAVASTDETHPRWAVLLTISVLAVVLFVAAAPVLRESAPRGRRGARSPRP